MNWRRICPLTDIPVGGTRSAEVGDVEVLVCRAGEREVYALENACSHDDQSMDGGPLDGCVLECPRHGARFDLRDGSVLRPPAAAPLRAFAVRLDEDDWIAVRGEVDDE